MSLLPPLPVAGPLAVAGFLLALGHVLPRRAPDVVALLAALAAGAVCVVMASQAAAHPIVYWFGGWVPRQGFPIGIGFVVGQAGAAFAAFIALLFAATIVFAWGYFDEVHAHFHVLMLLFMAGMIGFCLTHDLFNMFVWFEVQSIAGFALTGYQLRSSALEGALNFTVTNTIGAYLILAGIGLIYGRVGVLDFSALQAGVAKAPHDIVIDVSFALLSTGFLIKAAQVPFQFWLADAHAVAPSPVSVIFSGAMVALGIFGVTRLFWAVYAPAPEIQAVVRTLFLGMGTASAVVGGLMAISQRHLKRLLAFSTISHIGLLLIGFSLESREGLAGLFVYLAGHGLVKGAMFMVAGVLLAELASIDEIGLRGLGGQVWPAGVAMGLGGLLLAGLPLGLMGAGTDLLDAAAKAAGEEWVPFVVVFAAACTGGAVLRATGRIFLGLGPVAGEEKRAPTEDEQEKADRPLWVMLLPIVVLLSVAVLGGQFGEAFASRMAGPFMQPDNAGVLGLMALKTNAELNLLHPPRTPLAWLSVLLALAIAGFNLLRQRLPENLPKLVDMSLKPVFAVVQKLHSGLIGDYIAWVTVGLAMFTIAFAWSG
jgi:multicomponent Na+:H+ antiporter subunit D